MRLRKSRQFRNIYATGMWINASPTQFRFVFIADEPIETEVADEKNPARNITHEPHCQAEVIMSRPLVEWLKNSLDEHLKKMEVKTQ